MKYIILICAGMAGEALPELEGRTPLMAANNPHMDMLAQKAEVGMVRSIAPGMPADASIAELAVLGYAPEIYCQGNTAKKLDPLRQLYGVNGAMVFAETRQNSLANAAGLHCIPIEKGADTISMLYQRKVRAAVKALAEGYNFLYIHLEEAAQCSRKGDLQGKIQAIETMDQKLLAPLLEALKQQEEKYALLLTPGYAIPLFQNSPSKAPVPFAIYRSDRDSSPNAAAYNEKDAAASGLFLAAGPMLMQRLTGKYQCDFQFDTIPGF